MQLLRDQSLKSLNTFGIEAKCDYLALVASEEDLLEIACCEIFGTNRRLILGGGSNILFTSDFHGLVIKLNNKSLKTASDYESAIMIEGGAGLPWHELVATCVYNKIYGLENLALIPGSVGAAPVQNIGAYGAEQSQFMYSVRGLDIDKGIFVELDNEDCEFSYRDSIFKNSLKDKFIITSVKYSLNRQESLNLSYKELRAEFEKLPTNSRNAENLMKTVIQLRQGKLPDPKVLGNAGSFFKNPIISYDVYERIKKDYKTVPYFSTGELIKIPAAWLIEQCGWKGRRIGDAGVFVNHSLILVNYNNTAGSQILELSDMIKESVLMRFGIGLEPEVQIIN